MSPSKKRSAPGHGYWQSLEEWAGDESFSARLAEEFPESALEAPDGVSRRSMLQWMSASMALAGLTSCRWPAEEIVPFDRRPESYRPGRIERYASTLNVAGATRPVLVSSFDGRPIKIEGNPEHPASLGGADALTQARLLELYDQDRSRQPVAFDRGLRQRVQWADFQTVAARWAVEIPGERRAVLSRRVTSPSLEAAALRLQERFPGLAWYEFDAGGAAPATGWTLDLEKARILVDLDADLLVSHPNAVANARGFARGRRPEREVMNRLYVFEPLPSATGSAADHRIPLAGSRMVAALAFLAGQLAASGGLPRPELLAGFDAGGASHRLESLGTPELLPTLEAAAGDLVQHAGQGIVAIGHRYPAAAQDLATRLNRALGNDAGPMVRARRPAPELETGDLETLVERLRAGEIDHLLILDGNPVYDAPRDLDFASAFAQAGVRIHLGLFEDETARASTWHLPLAHDLEAWGDAWDTGGRLCAVQPLIEPLFGGRTETELISLLADETPSTGYDMARRTLAEVAGLPELGFDKAWRRYLHDGFVEATALEAAAEQDAVELGGAQLAELLESTTESAEPELDLRPDSKVHDGRYANNAWLQELPDALTKITWGNAALVAPSLAEERGLGHEDVVRLTTEVGSVELPIYVLPGMAPGVVSVTLGYGREQAGRVGNGVGADAYALQSWPGRWSMPLTGFEAERRASELACTQDHWAIDNRGQAERQRRISSIVREGTLEELEHHPEFAHHLGVHHPPLLSLWQERQGEGHQWGMAIDLSTCIGCNACVVACQAENNIPVVGKEQVGNGREMHWMRLDRYFHGNPDSATVAVQPMACSHCEMAPCEQVCPVGATMHSEEGLNVMAYNRCVGTRYCSNNCPYKVRRFNFFNYNKDVPELRQLGMNPEVTVRARGVMEKCTYCVQRIEHARIEARNEGRQLADGDIQTACQQTCPTQAIVFGDLADRESRVASLHEDDRAYALLGELNLKPRTVYLARIRNPHPDLTGREGEEATGGDAHASSDDHATQAGGQHG